MEEGGGGLIGEFDQGIVFGFDVDFPEFAVLHRDSVDGHGIYVLVGEDAAGYVSEGEGVGDDGMDVGGAVDWSSIDSNIAEDVREVGGEVGGEVQDVGGEESGARSQFHCVEGGGSAQLVPHVGELDGEEAPEGGMGPGAGVEVAGCAYAVGARGVVAEGGVV